jgi:hypothetical protein
VGVEAKLKTSEVTPSRHRARDGSHEPDRALRPSEMDALHDIGYSILGPLLAAFSLWLLQACRSNSPSKLFFLSRDGYHLMRAFAKASDFYGVALDCEYLYVSRRSVMMANFEPHKEGLGRLLDKLIKPENASSISSYCEVLGIDFPSAEELSSFGLPGPDVILESASLASRKTEIKTQLQHFFASRLSELTERAAHERDAYVKYLRAVGAYDQRRLCVVDCGWFGSTLLQIQQIMRSSGKDVGIDAYLIGAYPSPELALRGITLHGYLFNSVEETSGHRRLIETARLIELFLKTDQPPFYCFEEAPEGQLRPLHGVRPAKEVGLEAIQQAAFQFLDDWLANPEGTRARLSGEEIRSALAILLERPSITQARALGCRHYSVTATSNESQSHFAMPKLSLWQMITRPDLRRREISASGSKQIYRALCGSAAKRFLVDLTPVDGTPATRLHAAISNVRGRFPGRKLASSELSTTK